MSKGPRIARDEALTKTAEFVKLLRAIYPRVEIAGSIRRGLTEVGDVDIVVLGSSDAMPRCDLVCSHMRAEGRVEGVPVGIVFATTEGFGAALLYYTGSAMFNIRQRSLAKRNGFKLNEYGLWDGERRIAGEDEEGIFKRLGMRYLEPQMRS